jgi:hypothetical protein
MGRLIYFVNISKVYQHGFCVEFFSFGDIILQNKNLCFGFDILNKLLTFFVLDKANLL